MFNVLKSINLLQRCVVSRSLSFSNIFLKLVHYKLSDIGEGIAEVQIKDWLVNFFLLIFLFFKAYKSWR